jgi:diadenosine tetraphosphate (Ap4A) HIT family hydrolase
MYRILTGMLVQCAFCASMSDLSPFGDVVYEDDHCAVLLHPDSAVAGHAMVIWRRHVENIADLGSAERDHLFSIHARAERVLLAETKRERSIVMKLGIMTAHLHLHIYPFSNEASRDEVMRAIDGNVMEERPAEFAGRVRRALTAAAA